MTMIFGIAIACLFAVKDSTALLQKDNTSNAIHTEDQSTHLKPRKIKIETTPTSAPDTIKLGETDLDNQSQEKEESNRQIKFREETNRSKRIRILLPRLHMNNQLFAKYFARLRALNLKFRRRNNSFFNPIFNYLGVQKPRKRT